MAQTVLDLLELLFIFVITFTIIIGSPLFVALLIYWGLS